MTHPLVRNMAVDDRDAVIAWLAESEPWTTLGYDKDDWEQYFSPLPLGRESFVIVQDVQVAGLAIVRQKFLLGDYLELLGIAPSARGKGLGTLLLRHVESIVFGRTKNLFACVSDFNIDARGFYQRHGYREIGSLPDLIVGGSAELLLRKTTGPVRTSQ
ncbi:MAG TPA: GNAT family N-acetyltransferase [Nitrospira sp.]|nr:GNAT family N-acetyltransferase [Nitrospira sp.]